MPVRDFAAGGVVRTAVGTANPSGAFTMVALVQFNALTNWMIARQATATPAPAPGRRWARKTANCGSGREGLRN